MMMVRLMMIVMILHGDDQDGDGEALWCMMYDVDV